MYRRIYGLIDRYPKLKDKFNTSPIVHAALNSDSFVEEVLVNTIVVLSDAYDDLRKSYEELIINKMITIQALKDKSELLSESIAGNKADTKTINITDVRIKKKFEDEPHKTVLAVAQITIDNCFVVNDIKVVRSEDDRMIVSMPSRKVVTTEGEKFMDISHPVNRETREHINKVVLDAFDKAEN